MKLLNRKESGLIGMISALLILFAETAAAGGLATISWQANSEPFISGYRVWVGESSGEYNQTFDAGDVTAFEVPEIAAGREYFCAVTAYNLFGVESAPSSEIIIRTIGDEGNSNEGRLILLEAEAGALSNSIVVTGNAPEEAIEASDASESGESLLEFEGSIASDYMIWCRVQAPTNGADSFHVTLDDAEEQIFHVYGVEDPAPSEFSSNWVWRPITSEGVPQSHRLDVGVHQLRFRTREQGTRIDRVVLSSEPNFVPNDFIPRTGDLFAFFGNSGASATAEGEGVTLWARTLSVGNLSYQWFRNGVPIAGANDPFLFLPKASVLDDGEYTLEVTRVSDGALFVLSSLSLSVAPIPFEIQSFAKMEGNDVQFALQGHVRRDLEVQASSTLAEDDWISLGVQNNDTGELIVSDPGAEEHDCRFYRVVLAE